MRIIIALLAVVCAAVAVSAQAPIPYRPDGQASPIIHSFVASIEEWMNEWMNDPDAPYSLASMHLQPNHHECMDE